MLCTILITNDDGIHALGIRKLVECLHERANVYIVAPAKEKSSAGHGVTPRAPLVTERISFYGMKNVEAWKVNGSPADCVRVALHALLPVEPDIILSGINCGWNLGKDVYYSGTVGAAREGALHGIPSVALSYDNHFYPSDFGDVQNILSLFLYDIDYRQIPSDVVLNINLPHRKAAEVKGVCYAGLDLHHYTNRVEKEESGLYTVCSIERDYHREYVAGGDIDMLLKGYITVTPLQMNMTDMALLENMQNWLWRGFSLC